MTKGLTFEMRPLWNLWSRAQRPEGKSRLFSNGTWLAVKHFFEPVGVMQREAPGKAKSAAVKAIGEEPETWRSGRCFQPQGTLTLAAQGVSVSDETFTAMRNAQAPGWVVDRGEIRLDSRTSSQHATYVLLHCRVGAGRFTY